MIPWLIFLSVFQSLALGASPVRALLQENRLEEAGSICRQFEVLSTHDNDNFLTCAWVFLRTDRKSSADKMMARVKKTPPSPELELIKAYSLAKQKQFESARKIIGELGKEHRMGSFALLIQEISAEVYEMSGQSDTAAFIYRQMINEDPNRVKAHWGLARYYLEKNDPGRAVGHLEQTAKFWPKHLASRYNLGILYIQSNNLVEAAKWLTEAYRINQADAGVLEQLGILFEKKKQIPEALKYWQKAVAISPESTIAKEKFGIYAVQVIDSMIEERKYTEALAHLQTYGKNAVMETKLLLRRGIIYRNLAKFNQAILDLTAYVKNNPGDGMALRELGVAFLNVKLLPQAYEYFKRAVLAEPGNGANYAWLGFVLETRGDYEQAYVAWRKASEMLTNPVELKKANRRIAALEKKIPKGKKEEDNGQDDEE